MQEPMVAQREQRHPLVKVQFDQSAWMIVSLSAMGSAIFWFIAVVGLFIRHGSEMDLYYVLLATTTTLVTYLHSIRTRFTMRLEHKRQAAAWGDRRLLANSQPVPTAQTLTLPFTMPMRPRWGKLVSMLLMVTASLFLLIVLAPHAMIMGVEHSPVLFWFLIGVFVLLLSSLFFTFYSTARQQITLTEHGIIQVGILARPKSIPWSQIRLFAVVPVPFSRRSSNQSPVSFEVASADESIQWFWAQSSGTFNILFFARPAVSPADYEQQMRGMLAVIQQRTHLPLVDLRKPL
ncbi:MAG TPA: hypothetical protein VFB12_31785 [Ktedonobacteraceae bacterium]|nr:hypothetical protein [Ktedonobacteraceae bacterium]